MIKRRSLLTGGLALPFLPYGLAACSRGEPELNPYLQSNYGPVDVESTITDLKITGTIPRELNGRFLRNGPNFGLSELSDSVFDHLLLFCKCEIHIPIPPELCCWND